MVQALPECLYEKEIPFFLAGHRGGSRPHVGNINPWCFPGVFLNIEDPLEQSQSEGPPHHPRGFVQQFHGGSQDP